MSDQWLQHTLERIEKKLDKVNGSVRDVQIWRGRITGGLAILTVLIVPILLYITQQVIASR